MKYKSNGLWRSSWQSRWAGGVDQDVRMRTKRRGWWWRGGTRGHKALHPIAIRLDWTPPAFSALGKIHHLVLALLSDDAPLSCWVFIIYSAEACTLWPTLSGDPRILLLGLVSAHDWSVAIRGKVFAMGSLHLNISLICSSIRGGLVPLDRALCRGGTRPLEEKTCNCHYRP